MGRRPSGEPTASQRWRRRRDLAIYALHRRLHFSQVLLADVFDLARSRIHAIVRDIDAEGEARRRGKEGP
jgi:hypothetical protein